MIKKILIIIGVASFSVFWWVGFQKVREMPKTEVSYGGEPKELGKQQ